MVTFMRARIAQRHCPSDPVAIRAALLHITIDEICTRNPEFKKTLEAAAILGVERKREGEEKDDGSKNLWFLGRIEVWTA